MIDVTLSGDVAHMDGREADATEAVRQLGRGNHRITFWTRTPEEHAPRDALPPPGGRGAWTVGCAYYRDPAQSWDAPGPADPGDLWREVRALRSRWGAASATSAAAALVSPVIAGRVSRDAPHLAEIDSAIKGGLMWCRVGTWSADPSHAGLAGAPAPHHALPAGWRIYSLDQRSAYPWHAARLRLPDTWGPEGGEPWAVRALVRVRSRGILPGGPLPWRARHGGIEWASDAVGEGVWWAPLLEWAESCGAAEILSVRRVWRWKGGGQWLGSAAGACVAARDEAPTGFQAHAARAVGRRIFGVLATRAGKRAWIPMGLYARGTLAHRTAGDPVEPVIDSALDLEGEQTIDLPDGRRISQPGAILRRDGRRWVSARVWTPRPPFSEPAWACGIESAATLAVLEMTADLHREGARVIYADTDGCVVAGRPGAVVRAVRRAGGPWQIRAESPAFAVWGPKRYYLTDDHNAWAGAVPDVRELLQTGVTRATIESVTLGERIVRSHTLRVVDGALRRGDP